MPAPNSTDRLLAAWRRLEGLPAGRWLFSRLLRRAIPYSGTIGARVLELEPGRARLTIDDRPGLRNHLRSVHAIALANLGELTTGLAFSGLLPGDARGIPICLTIDYLKKARGTISAHCECDGPPDNREAEYEVAVDLTDVDGDVVARVTALWRVGPRT